MMASDPIAAVRWRRVAVPFRAAVTNSQATYRVRESVLVEIRAQSGALGIGEAALPAGSSFAANGDALEARLEAIASRLPGRSPEENWRETHLDLAENEYASWPAAVVCGIETALADLAAQDAGMPLFRWLAAESGRGGENLSGAVKANGLIDLVEPKGAATTAGELVDSGFRTLKLKVGGDIDRSLATVAAVRDAAGPDIELRCDANRAWPFDQARSFLQGSQPFNIAVLEEPLASPGANFELLAALQSESHTMLGADESARSVAALERAIAAGIRLLVVKPMASGLRTSLDLVRRAQSAGMQVIITTTFDLAPGTAMAMHLSALGDPDVACGVATLDLVEEPLGDGVPAIVRGGLTLEDQQGLGVKLDHAAIERFAAGPWERISR